MDAKGYLESYGWKEGEALLKGGLRRPILVSHKRDHKGVGKKETTDAWWETLFGKQLQDLDINKAGSVSLEQKSKVSPLYRSFIKGKGLEGTIDNKPTKTPEKVKSEKHETQIKRKDANQADNDIKFSSDQLHTLGVESRSRSKTKSKSKSKSRSLSESNSNSKSKSEKSSKSKKKSELDSSSISDSSPKEVPKIRKESIAYSGIRNQGLKRNSEDRSDESTKIKKARDKSQKRKKASEGCKDTESKKSGKNLIDKKKRLEEA